MHRVFGGKGNTIQLGHTVVRRQVNILNSSVPSCAANYSLDLKPTSPLNGNLIPRPPETVSIKLRADKQETEDFYLEKFREFSMQNSVISRLQARADSMSSALSKTVTGLERAKSNAASFGPKRPRRKRIGRQVRLERRASKQGAHLGGY